MTASDYMAGRGVRDAHLKFELHDGRKVWAGTNLEGWWVSVYRDGHCEQGGRGRTLSQALHDAGAPGGTELLNELLDRLEDSLS